MKKEIVINVPAHQIEIREDGSENTFPIADDFDFKKFKSENEAKQFIKNYLVSGGYILDDINNYEVKII